MTPSCTSYPLTDSDVKRFWSKVNKSDTCWLWTNVPAKNGYGYLGVGGRSGRNIQAHRIAYELAHGPIPDGLHIDHLCRVRNCVNPSHLEAVTNRENGLRGISPAAKHSRATHCPKGHSYSEQNTRRGSRGQRVCRICHSEWARKSKMKARHPEKYARYYSTTMVENGAAIAEVLEFLGACTHLKGEK